MRRLVPVLVLAASVAAAQPLPPPGRNTFAARVTLNLLDGSDRGVGFFQTVHVTAEEQLVLRGPHAELVVRGRSARQGAFLGPRGPYGERAYTDDFAHRWTGEARDEGGALLLRFVHTTATAPPSACDLTLRCVRDATVADALRCVPLRPIGHHGADRWVPSYLRVPLLLGHGRWLIVDAYGHDGEPGTARARATR